MEKKEAYLLTMLIVLKAFTKKRERGKHTYVFTSNITMFYIYSVLKKTQTLFNNYLVLIGRYISTISQL